MASPVENMLISRSAITPGPIQSMTNQLTLATDRLRLTIDVAYGGRVVGLVDNASGRDWLVPDRGPRDLSAIVFGADVARGWDECFPTVAPVDGRPFGWQGQLRDHGALWGVPTETALAGNRLDTRWSADQFVFSREIVAEGATLSLGYAVTNTGAAPFSYLYSQHMLLATRPGDTIALEGIKTLTDIDTGKDEMWPVPALADVQGIESGIASKLYGAVAGDISARIGDAAGTINIAWHRDDMPSVGLWIDYGGWPVGGPPVHQVAIEPTTAQAHGLTPGQRSLAPGETHRWSISIRLDSHGP